MGKEGGKRGPFSGMCIPAFEQVGRQPPNDMPYTQPLGSINRRFVRLESAFGRRRSKIDYKGVSVSEGSRLCVRGAPLLAKAGAFTYGGLLWIAAAFQRYAARRIGASQYHEQPIATRCLVS
jgi:hypothetical protein